MSENRRKADEESALETFMQITLFCKEVGVSKFKIFSWYITKDRVTKGFEHLMLGLGCQAIVWTAIIADHNLICLILFVAISILTSCWNPHLTPSFYALFHMYNEGLSFINTCTVLNTNQLNANLRPSLLVSVASASTSRAPSHPPDAWAQFPGALGLIDKC